MRSDKDRYLSEIKYYSPNELLINASKFQDIDNVKLAIKNGANIHYNVDCALYNGLIYDNVEIVEILLKSGDFEIDYSIIESLLRNNRCDMIKCFLNNNIIINVNEININYKQLYNIILREYKLNKIIKHEL